MYFCTVMATIKDIYFNFREVPPSWRFCFCSDCPKCDDCLRFQTGKHIPESMTWGSAVFPTAYKNGACRHFKQIRFIHAAYGFSPLFSDVKQKDYTALRNRIKAYLGGHGTYYRYNRGEKLLTPEQQEWVLRLFAHYGYSENMAFENYCDVLDFSE